MERGKILKLFTFVSHIALIAGLIVSIENRGISENHRENFEVGYYYSHEFFSIGTVNLLLFLTLYLFTSSVILLIQLCEKKIDFNIECILLFPFEITVISVFCGIKSIFELLFIAMTLAVIPLVYFIQKRIDKRENEILLLMIKYSNLRIPRNRESIEERKITYPLWKTKPFFFTILLNVFVICSIIFYCSIEKRQTIVYCVVVSEMLYLLLLFIFQFIKRMNLFIHVYSVAHRLLLTASVYLLINAN